jgi:Type VI secretion system, TssN
MAYKTILLIAGALVFINFLIIKLVKGKVKVFVKRSNWYLLTNALLCALLGLTGLLARQPADVQPPVHFILLQLMFLGLGILHTWLLFKVLPWADRKILKLEFLFTGLLVFSGGLVFFTVFHLFEKAAQTGQESFVNNQVSSILLFPMPLLVLKIFDAWLTIPKQVVKAWDFPIGTPPIAILPGNLMRITVWVTVKFKSNEIEKFDTLAPKDTTLGEVFYYLMHRHNFDPRKRNRKIEIAENNSRHKIFKWLFFKEIKRWWWISNKYFNPEMPLGKLDIENGDIIIAGRVKDW